MGFLQVDTGPFLIERRLVRRSRATCAASLQTLTGEIFGELWDLSQTGAKIRIDDPPQPGSAAALKWGKERVMCRIVWSKDDICGVVFDWEIGRDIVAATAGMIGVVEQPIAAIGKIPVGRKRSAQANAEQFSIGDSAQTPLNWIIHLRRDRVSRISGDKASLTSAEEMFFFGSPLAHVVAHEAKFTTSPIT